MERKLFCSMCFWAILMLAGVNFAENHWGIDQWLRLLAES